jgi:hypothetical protein
MKTNLKVAIFAIILTSANTLFAQRHLPHHHPHHHGIQQTIVYQGTVAEWITNPDFAYDGFYLGTPNGTVPVKFPPHMGQQVNNAVKKGGNVTVNGVMRVSPEGESELKMVSLTSNGNIIYDMPPTRRLLPPSEKFVSGGGKVQALQTDKRGMLIGYFLDNDVILRIPPHNSYQLSNILSIGSSVQYTGTIHMHDAEDGPAYAKKVEVVHCKTLTINGTQYLVI